MIRSISIWAKLAQKDAQKLAAAGLKENAQALLAIVRDNPFQNPAPYEKLLGNLAGAYSRRISIQHRLVYQVLETERVVKVLRLWSHYDLATIFYPTVRKSRLSYSGRSFGRIFFRNMNDCCNH